ncbi:phytanoyl-CoA dioxygenase [Agarivorans sp. B2Z047]|uniref:phytanoyl-CoA dioxygenase family protein n=1 Tax=Agarivorans sp. B2Z047 TaxID=2652721 RepID=UPI00128C2886|nr:phytanoyl-CoA dioxygenase family protein [Agarivorans sp. B2Z047]MPW31733.1 phytanoyl-CoA dioxygenase [Agarivorans sp. B2Z047]UQN44796.1 phytanoyl-CoA dioxygenase family protein [Agarivorans sp. B2Z047]
MDLKALSDQFWRDGYLLIEDFFSMQLMNQMTNAINEHYGVDPEFWHTNEFLDRAKTEVIPWFPQNEGCLLFNEVDQHPYFKALSKAVLGEDSQTLYCMVMFSKQGTVGQAWHQDCDPDDPKRFNINRLIYTSDIRQDIGGEVVVVPRSHLRGEIPIGDPESELPGQLVLRPKKGSLIFLHGHTWHRVLPIHGGNRISTNYRAVPKGTPLDITDICVYRNMRYHFGSNKVVEERQ